MKISELKAKVIQIIREYSNNGELIGSGDNKDYLLSIPGAISDAQIEISKIRPIYKQITLSEPDSVSAKYKRFLKPKSFKQIENITLNDEMIYDYSEDIKNILIPKEYSGEIILTYEKIPDTFSSDVSEDYELEIDEDVQFITAYKAASVVYIDDQSEWAIHFLNEYKRLLSTIDIKKKKSNPQIVCYYTP